MCLLSGLPGSQTPGPRLLSGYSLEFLSTDPRLGIMIARRGLIARREDTLC